MVLAVDVANFYITEIFILEKMSIKDKLSTICSRRILQFFELVVRRTNDNLERLTGKVEGKRHRG